MSTKLENDILINIFERFTSISMSNPPFDSDHFSMDTSQFIRIPLKRIGAVIGLGGNNKEKIEGLTETLIIIDSDTGEVEIRPNENLKDPVKIIKSKEIVTAIGRGFPIEEAIKLGEDDIFLEIIRLKPIVGNKPNQLYRVRARLIGTDGKTRKSIQELTGTKLVVSGATVSLLGTYEEIGKAKEAVVSLINGAKIESVLASLEDHRKETKKEEEKLWKSEDDEKTMEELFVEETATQDPFEDYETEQ